MSRWSAVGLAGFAGIAAGLVLFLGTLALERSRVVIGPYALYGNGALVVAAVGGPLLLYAGWSAIERAFGTSAAALAAYALGLGAPLGAASLLFVLPTALVTALLWFGFRSGRLPATPLVLGGAAALGVIAPYIAPAIGGLLAGGLLVAPALVAAGTRVELSWRAGVGVGLAALLLTSAFVVPLLLPA